MAPAYRIGKGPIVVALEAFLRESDGATVRQYYDQLLNEALYLETLKQALFDDSLEVRDPEAHVHLMRDVFGPGPNAANLPPDELEEAEQRGLSRRLVYGRGVRRALELAYGFGSGAAPFAEPWTLDVYWGCGQPYNLVGLRTNPEKKVVTLIIYSDEVATGDERDTVVKRDPAEKLVPDDKGALLLIDDREGIGKVNEWRATKAIGLG